MGGNWINAYSSWRIADLEADATTVRVAPSSHATRLRPIRFRGFWRVGRRPLAESETASPDPGERARPAGMNDNLLDPALAQ
jgi:hypothetical protein